MKYLLNLGDSITISLYPNLDAAERFNKSYKGLGAGDLLFRNNDELFPEFYELDLATIFPGIKHVNLAQDGAMIPTVYKQIDKAIRSINPNKQGLITLTVGGNDLLQLYNKSTSIEEMQVGVERLSVQFEALVGYIKDTFPGSQVILNSVYDPTDATGYMPGSSTKLPLEFLSFFNLGVEEVANRYNCAYADIEFSFMGYGMTLMSEDGKTLDKDKCGYYWHHSIIEPSIYGANALRADWLELV